MNKIKNFIVRHPYASSILLPTLAPIIHIIFSINFPTWSWRGTMIPFLHPERDLLEKYLLKHGIDTERYFDYSVPELKQYKHNGKYPNAEHISKQMINLPINMKLNESGVKYVIDKIFEFDAENNS